MISKNRILRASHFLENGRTSQSPTISRHPLDPHPNVEENTTKIESRRIHRKQLAPLQHRHARDSTHWVNFQVGVPGSRSTIFFCNYPLSGLSISDQERKGLGAANRGSRLRRLRRGLQIAISCCERFELKRTFFPHDCLISIEAKRRGVAVGMTDRRRAIEIGVSPKWKQGRSGISDEGMAEAERGRKEARPQRPTAT